MLRAETEAGWVEGVLEQKLCRVAAPGELWERVLSPAARRPGVRRSARDAAASWWQTKIAAAAFRCARFSDGANAARRSACATVCAALLVVAAVWLFHLKSGSAVQYRSADPGAVRAWVLTKTGLDVPLHSGQLAGARVIPGRVEAAEIAYRIGKHDATVTVSRAGSVSAARGALVSWVARGQTYSLACDSPADLRGCLLCHVGS